MVHEVGTGADEKTAELPAHNCGAPESTILGSGNLAGPGATASVVLLDGEMDGETIDRCISTP